MTDEQADLAFEAIVRAGERIKELEAMIAKQRAIINELKEEVERLLAAINDALEQEGE